MLQVDVTELKRQPGESAHFNLKSEFPPLEYGGEKCAFAGPVMVSVSVLNAGGLFQVEGDVSGNLEFNCSRCLEPFNYAFTVPLAETYYSAGQGKADTGEEAVPFEGDVIDLAPEVQKSILMSLPMKVVCRPECRGLCWQCGCNLNENVCECAEAESSHSRLAALENFFKE